MTKGRKIPNKDLKILWGLAAGRCAFPGCRTECIIVPTDADPHAIIGKIAHINAHSDDGPRADPGLTAEERDSYENWLLLCANHHDIVDKQPNTYSKNILDVWKSEHENWVKEKLNESMTSVGFHELEMVTTSILARPSFPTDNLHLISPRAKIIKNSLSESSASLILTGMIKSFEVENYVREVSKTDPTFPEKLSNGFINEFNRLKEEGLSGDVLFETMWEFSSGRSQDFMKRSAGLAALVYLFQKCEIFEK